MINMRLKDDFSCLLFCCVESNLVWVVRWVSLPVLVGNVMTEHFEEMNLIKPVKNMNVTCFTPESQNIHVDF